MNNSDVRSRLGEGSFDADSGTGCWSWLNAKCGHHACWELLTSSSPPTSIMDTPSTSAAALKLEIERLKGSRSQCKGCRRRPDDFLGAINRHKSGEPARPTAPAAAVATRPRNNVYVNPNYKPPSKTFSPPVPPANQARPAPRPPTSIPQEKRDVLIGGVAFESSGRSLVRKDCKFTLRSSLSCVVSGCGSGCGLTIAR